MKFYTVAKIVLYLSQAQLVIECNWL